MRLYTVDRTNSITLGQVLTLTDIDPFSLPYWTVNGLFTENDLHTHAQTLFPEGLSLHGWRYLKERHTHGTNPHFQHNASFLAEMSFEYVRKACFPEKPSRFQSIFACETPEDARMFKAKMGRVENRIYEVDCAEALRVDMSLIVLGTQNVTGSFLAHKYWRGEPGNNPFWEFIVKLPAKVIEELPD